MNHIHRIFDFVGPSGFMPNGVNYNYTIDAWNRNFYIDNNFIEQFSKKYLQISVYDCFLNIGEYCTKDYHIDDIHYNEETNTIGNPIETYYYTISPFGNVLLCIGDDFTYHQNKHTFDFISVKARKYLKAKNFYLVFDYSSEGDIKPDIFYNIHNTCARLDINPSKVLIITASANTTELYKNYYVKENNPKDLLKTTCYPWPIFAKSKETRDLLRGQTEMHFNGYTNLNSITKTKDLFQLKNREKKALMLNRRLRPHRLIILSLLQNDGLLNDTLSSFDMEEMLYTPEAGLDLVSGGGYDGNPYIEPQHYKNKMSTGFRNLSKIKKRVVDYEDFQSIWGFAFETKDIYEKTYFSIVPETLFYETGTYISEKTLKPIAHLHPFILVGRPGILKTLKSYGFKTFDEFWDESYDDIENNSDRIIKIYELIKSLITKSNEEWDEMMKKMFHILEYNRNHLLKYTDKYVAEVYAKNLNKIINHNEEIHLL
jgi:hypothetical protein